MRNKVSLFIISIIELQLPPVSSINNRKNNKNKEATLAHSTTTICFSHSRYFLSIYVVVNRNFS